MSIIRTEMQADAQEMLKLIIETADFQRAMGELLSQENMTHALFDIAKEREGFIEPFQQAVKSLGELPATPDADKEWIDELRGKLTQLLSDDSKKAIFDKCLEKDEMLAEFINRTTLGEQSDEFKELLDSLNDHLIKTKERLSDS